MPAKRRAQGALSDRPLKTSKTSGASSKQSRGIAKSKSDSKSGAGAPPLRKSERLQGKSSDKTSRADDGGQGSSAGSGERIGDNNKKGSKKPNPPKRDSSKDSTGKKQDYKPGKPDDDLSRKLPTSTSDFQSLVDLVKKDPCKAFNQWFALHKTKRIFQTGAYHTVENETLLNQDNMLLGIASVTEAINRLTSQQGYTFSLASPGVFTTAIFIDPATPGRVVRPRRTFFLPWITGELLESDYDGVSEEEAQKKAENEKKLAHIFLTVAVIRSGPNNSLSLPRLYWLDSAKKNYISDDQRAAMLRKIRRMVTWLEWFHGPGSKEQVRFLPDQEIPVTKQKINTACGLHTILNAWILALGMVPSASPIRNYDPEFYVTLVEIINLSLAGCMDAWTIYAFLLCRSLIATDQVPMADRIFTSTVRMQGVGTLDAIYNNILAAENLEFATSAVTALPTTPAPAPGPSGPPAPPVADPSASEKSDEKKTADRRRRLVMKSCGTEPPESPEMFQATWESIKAMWGVVTPDFTPVVSPESSPKSPPNKGGAKRKSSK